MPCKKLRQVPSTSFPNHSHIYGYLSFVLRVNWLTNSPHGVEFSLKS